ncbi:MAG: 16S rRNA (guanine(966)-N(2))-methyltransferase RsmD [Pseudomonadales bacterium]
MSFKPQAPKSSRANVGAVRIIGGQWRGRKLAVPEVEGLRPTGDRVRETLFNWLRKDLYQARCIDLFAGSGALGFEALSQGASYALMLEKDRGAISLLEQNIQLFTAAAEVTRVDTLAWLKEQHDAEQTFDIAFVDPPFALNCWDETLALLTERHLIKHEGYIYVECPLNHPLELPKGWHWHKQGSGGQVSYGLLAAST